jgi:hypothetical protein
MTDEFKGVTIARLKTSTYASWSVEMEALAEQAQQPQGQLGVNLTRLLKVCDNTHSSELLEQIWKP